MSRLTDKLLRVRTGLISIEYRRVCWEAKNKILQQEQRIKELESKVLEWQGRYMAAEEECTCNPVEVLIVEDDGTEHFDTPEGT